MKATEAKLLEFLKKSPQFVIPIYQRSYSWTERECSQLWDDILRTGRNENVAAHFVGSIVYVEKGLYSVSNQTPLLVIDGQQRLTTITLLLEALARNIGDQEPIEGFSPIKLRNYYMLNSLEAGERKYKLILSQTDKTTLISLLEQREKPNEHSIRIEENFNYFLEMLKSTKDELQAICKGLAKLVIVDISLSRDQDNPQLIFESLNSTGKELSQADLIRNFILMGLEPDLQTKFYEYYWRQMEIDFGQEGYGIHFDGFMRYYLTVKTGDLPNINQVYEAFKKHARSPKAGTVETLLADIRNYSKYYSAMIMASEQDPELKLLFHDIRELKVDVAIPLLLELYHDYTTGILSKEEFLQTGRLIESYVFRRAICGIPTNSMNKTFSMFSRFLKKDRYLESIKAHFLLLPSYRRFPSDDEFVRAFQIKDLYNFRSRSYWLRRIENFNRKERVPVDEYTIEHIMPQKEKMTDEWKHELGNEWERIHEQYLHTLGNLTLTGYNSEYGYKPFKEKRDMEGGFKESPLKLNEGLGQLEHWNEMSIINRGQKIATKGIEVWVSAKLEESILTAYKPDSERSDYSIDDHPYLASGTVHEIFESFRREVKSLDPCVIEEFLKLYVAYKAETNFVDVIPQAKQLRLSLNISFHEINDPKGICRDVTGLGKWGNGDTEVRLSSLEDLPYVIGLVRQAFEKQMENGGEF